MNAVDAGMTVPLVVDIDGTLLKSDLLHEAALQFIAGSPLETWRLAAWLQRGKAEFKARLANRVDFGTDRIPLREETVAAIRAAQEAGRAVYLASASDRRWVETVADRIGGIAGVLASDGRTNLAGSAKAAALVERFGRQNFDYIGDNQVDMAVWSEARRQILVGRSARLEAAVLCRFPQAETIARPRVTISAYIRALRVHQWAKNALVFLPLIAGHSFTAGNLLVAAAAFLAFSLAASSAYIVNDLLDLAGDRDHPRKCRRPFAAGDVPITHGLGMAVMLMAAAALVAAALPPLFLAILAGYLALTLGYSLHLKRKVMIDVLVLGSLYTLRVFGGVAATGQQQSQWLLMFSLFLFLALATVKRCSELVARGDTGTAAPLGRGYVAADLKVLFPLSAAAGYGAVLVVALYLSSPEVIALYTHPKRLWLICPLLLYWISRVLILSNRNQLHDDPVIFALTDPVSWLTGLATAAVIAVSI